MKEVKDDITISDLVPDFRYISDDIIKLLEIEYSIKLKKAMGKELTRDEYFFDTFLVCPSSLLNSIMKRGDKVEKCSKSRKTR